MITYAKYRSIMTPWGRKLFRYHTEFHSANGPGMAIGLVYMMNPGDARPESEELFDMLRRSDISIEEPVLTKTDRTMSKMIRLIRDAYAYNNLELPETYTIHVENLFNLREKDSKQAQTLVGLLHGGKTDEVMYRRREQTEICNYHFVVCAWGKVEVLGDTQGELLDTYLNAIRVHKRNYKGAVKVVDYPVHPLYVNKAYFLEAAAGKVFV